MCCCRVVAIRERVSSKEAQARDPFIWSVPCSSETLIARQVLVIRPSEASVADLTLLIVVYASLSLLSTVHEKMIRWNPATKT